jgi:hypothetical protein
MATPPKRGRATVGVVVRVFGPISVLMLALASLGCLLLLPVGAQATQTAPPRIKPYEDVVALLDTHVARSHPKLDSKPVASVRATRPLTGQRTVLPALGHSIDSAGRLWLRIRLPGRALGGTTPPPTGWILATHTQQSTTLWHIVVNRSAHLLIVYRDGRPLRTFRAIVGKPSTPTPRGQYFVEENVRMASSQPSLTPGRGSDARRLVAANCACTPTRVSFLQGSKRSSVLREVPRRRTPAPHLTCSSIR